MKNKNLAQVLKPIIAPQFTQQREHIIAQFKKMLARGISRVVALQHAQFSVDSLIGNYAQASNQIVFPSVAKHNMTTITPIQVQGVFRRLRERVAWLCFSDDKIFQTT